MAPHRLWGHKKLNPILGFAQVSQHELDFFFFFPQRKWVVTFIKPLLLLSAMPGTSHLLPYFILIMILGERTNYPYPHLKDEDAEAEREVTGPRLTASEWLCHSPAAAH